MKTSRVISLGIRESITTPAATVGQTVLFAVSIWLIMVLLGAHGAIDEHMRQRSRVHVFVSHDATAADLARVQNTLGEICNSDVQTKDRNVAVGALVVADDEDETAALAELMPHVLVAESTLPETALAVKLTHAFDSDAAVQGKRMTTIGSARWRVASFVGVGVGALFALVLAVISLRWIRHRRSNFLKVLKQLGATPSDRRGILATSAFVPVLLGTAIAVGAFAISAHWQLGDAILWQSAAISPYLGLVVAPFITVFGLREVRQ